MKVGIDIVKISEFKNRLEISGGLEKVFIASEIRDNPRLESLAGIFAVKEAFMKAIGRKIDWQEVWIEKSESGKPELKSFALKQGEQLALSISHDGDYAIAVVILI